MRKGFIGGFQVPVKGVRRGHRIRIRYLKTKVLRSKGRETEKRKEWGEVYSPSGKRVSVH